MAASSCFMPKTIPVASESLRSSDWERKSEQPLYNAEVLKNTVRFDSERSTLNPQHEFLSGSPPDKLVVTFLTYRTKSEWAP
jgi:hypothetical protein